MDLIELRQEVKKIVLNSGAKLFGVGSKERLKDAPPSGDMEYCLPGAQSCIIWAYPNDLEALENYFSKKERMSIKISQDIGYATGWKTALKIAEFIEINSKYKAFPVIPNGKYRGGVKSIAKDGEAFPDFSLRYGGVSAGLGHIGWSGNLVTSEYGGSIYLDGVITTAPFTPDPMAEVNNCNECKICQKVCTTGYVSKDEPEDRKPVIIGGIKQVYGKRGLYMKCGFGCAGYTGLSIDEKWSIWSPNHICLKSIPDEDWNKEFIREMLSKLVSSNETPKTILRFNQTIAVSFGKVGRTENVGLRPIEDTNPRCGNCNFICVADPKKRTELYNMLKNSGKVFLDKKNREFVKKIDKKGENIIYYPPTWEEYLKNKEV
ncbi:hypothetical protein LCGC14_1132450 [marine sediment metagenome]|uniref:4Fe-4S ferredoxin-type domain-containing protein n=1 Tax=marine sediment metagenome TaxID=412755 RepID=A0A0F9PIY2_9ZZZZ